MKTNTDLQNSELQNRPEPRGNPADQPLQSDKKDGGTGIPQRASLLSQALSLLSRGLAMRPKRWLSEKSSPGRASTKSVPPKGDPQFSAGAERSAPGLEDFAASPSGRDERSPETKKENTMTKPNKPTTASGKAPAFHAYHVRDREGGKGFWTRIGAAWPHADGKGFNLQIDMVPLDGRISLRPVSEQSEAQPQA